MCSILTYQDITEEIKTNYDKKNQKSILLGNGFSIGYEADFFNYKKLIHAVKDKISDAGASLTELLNNKENPEYILKIMFDSTECIPIVNRPYLSIANINKPLGELKEDRQLLKKSLIDVFESEHPEYKVESEDLLSTCADKLKIYNQVYTTNYDLILYWSILKANELSKENHFKDGFYRNKNLAGEFLEDDHLLLWTPGNGHFNVMYLHGAIHLIRSKSKNPSDEGNIYKIKKAKDETFHLKDVIKQLRNDMSYENIVILEGTSEAKMELIINNPYLIRGLDRLSRSSGCFVVYGCSILKSNDKINNDEHIWTRIINANINKLYIGIHDDRQKYFDEKRAVIIEALDKLYHRRDYCSLEDKITFFSTKNNNDIWSARK